ncbi:hypothetical protein MMA231_02119 [Asticcacaulis sp. MM231]|uniref:DUF3307 domain-containing protein n=1 Tax=Asticcacaulis sp. MM231 TaxID=3157666 RepID=UPI0032D5AB77
MLTTFLALLTAHLISDFFLQTEWMVARKKEPAILLLHIAITVVAAAVTLGGTPIPILAILAVTHLFVDAIKTHLLKDSLRSFLADQLAHLIVIVGLCWLYPTTFHDWWWPHWLATSQLPYYLAGLCLASGIILNLLVGAILIRKMTTQFTLQIRDNIRGLEKGGYYIGLLERGLVMLFILINQPAGVGFLITAKSILRFGDVKNSTQRRSTEYIIIGTFMSFGWSFLIAVLTQNAIKHWLPGLQSNQ